MIPIPTTTTRLASDATSIPHVTEIEAALHIVENIARKVTLDTDLLALRILIKDTPIETNHLQETLIKFLTKEIKKLPPLQHRKGNAYFDWDNRLNKILMPKKEIDIIRPQHLDYSNLSAPDDSDLSDQEPPLKEMTRIFTQRRDYSDLSEVEAPPRAIKK